MKGAEMRELTEQQPEQVEVQICVNNTETKPGEKRRKLLLLAEVGLRDQQEPLSF